MMPNGREVLRETDVSDACYEGYRLMLECGCRLTAEMLTTGEVSCTIEEPDLGDFDISISPNGPEVPKGIEAMLKDFTVEKFNEWKKQAA